MKKLWNHYDPLDFEDIEQGAATCRNLPRVLPLPIKSAAALDRLYAWLFSCGGRKTWSLRPPAVPQTPCAPQAISAPTAFADHELRLQREQVQRASMIGKRRPHILRAFRSELVDYAVYGMEAAQKRYIYLLRSAGKEDSSLELRQ